MILIHSSLISLFVSLPVFVHLMFIISILNYQIWDTDINEYHVLQEELLEASHFYFQHRFFWLRDEVKSLGHVQIRTCPTTFPNMAGRYETQPGFSVVMNCITTAKKLVNSHVSGWPFFLLSFLLVGFFCFLFGPLVQDSRIRFLRIFEAIHP